MSAQDSTDGSRVRRDLLAGLTVSLMSIPQGVAYALIAGLPPAMGLYAGCIPAIVGSVFRSSRHVITGPTNALSLLIGEGIAAHAGLDPIPTAFLLAALIGGMQLGAGILRLGILVDYISMPVVLGYVTGAATLIFAGQLQNITQTPGGSGHLLAKITGWAEGIGEANIAAVTVALATAVAIVVLRRIDRRIPGAIIALVLATVAVSVFALGDLRTIADLGDIPRSLPPLTIPDIEGWQALLSLAFAGTVLSLVESTSVARATSAQTRQALDLSREFIGQGIANIAASFSGGYPTSGSLGRTAASVASGAATRLAGISSGVFVMASIFFFGGALSAMPVAALAGLLLVIAIDIVDYRRIFRIFKTGRSDAVAFSATLIGTWVLRLDQAIYVGVAISLVLFLRRARLLVVRAAAVGKHGFMQEVDLDQVESCATCVAIRILHVEGQLFFASAGELQSSLQEVARDSKVKAIIVRLKRAHGFDDTILDVLLESSTTLHEDGRDLLLVGMRDRTMHVLTQTGAEEVLGDDNLFPTRPRWFAAMNSAIAEALDRVGKHECRAEGCPLEAYVAERRRRVIEDPTDCDSDTSVSS